MAFVWDCDASFTFDELEDWEGLLFFCNNSSHKLALQRHVDNDNGSLPW